MYKKTKVGDGILLSRLCGGPIRKDILILENATNMVKLRRSADDQTVG